MKELRIGQNLRAEISFFLLSALSTFLSNIRYIDITMPPKKRKAESAGDAHPMDSSGVLQAAKDGRWAQFEKLLESQSQLSFEDFNTLPPGRAFGVVHQIAYHGHLPALEALLAAHPRVDVTLLTKQGTTALQVAAEEGVSEEFVAALQLATSRYIVQSLTTLARDGSDWPQFNALLSSKCGGDVATNLTALNEVPAGRKWGVLHQIAYWGECSALAALVAAHPQGVNHEIETRDVDATQTPRDIAIGRGHTAFCDDLTVYFPSTAAATSSSASGASCGQPTTGGAAGGAEASQSAVSSSSSSMKAPISADGQLCNICYCTDHADGSVGVACDNNHFLCSECFTSYVESESDTVNHPGAVIQRGGRILCVQASAAAASCDSCAFANKLIAMVVPDAIYEKYLQARDFVVGKEAVAGALAKVKANSGALAAVEQEQIRNLYRKADGTYSAYMCKQCSFGPIDHFACSDLSSHHGEAHGNGAINNACPKCGWFAKQIKQWPSWNGTFVDPSSAPQALSSSSSSAGQTSPRFLNRRMVFKGTLSITRANATAIARAAGAIVTTNVSSLTNIIVAGPGESFATPSHVEVWDENTFNRYLQESNNSGGSASDSDEGDY